MMKVEYFAMVYDSSSASLADYVAQKYHLKHNIIYVDESHPREKKEAFVYKALAGTSKCPFIGAYNKDNEIVDALWGEVTQITQETITNFFNKYEY